MARFAVASGKGGTGKTTVAAALAAVIGRDRAVRFLDCDVEAPNGRFLLHPAITETVPVYRRVPQADPSLCDGCARCSEVCHFNAIAVAGSKVLVFPELCHGCGGCALACPREAITERNHLVGEVAVGTAGPVAFTQGTLRAGETATVQVIREVRRRGDSASVEVLDCPPGTSCPVVAAVEDTDFVVLVTEPTPFGLNDLRLAVELVRRLGLRAGVVVNRDGSGDGRVDRYCRESGVPVLGRIPDDRAVAEAYSRGELPLDAAADFRAAIGRLAARLLVEAAG
jgi:MinD superfamily P-loop ATPase